MLKSNRIKKEVIVITIAIVTAKVVVEVLAIAIGVA